MPHLYPACEPYDRGELAVGDGHTLYWETCGNPEGRPAVVLHGGPGSGCTAWHRRLFDPGRYRVVLYDQRSCGRSKPHASEPDVDLETNTTRHLVADLERLRAHLGIDRWLVVGGSWGSTLALAYAERHVARVTGLILFGVTAGLRREFDHVFRGGLAATFPEQWRRLREFVLSDADRDGDVVEAVHRLLFDPSPDVRERAALEWCLWESAIPGWPPSTALQPRFEDRDYALAFARLVTHYVRHAAWIEDAELLIGADVLAEIPVILIDGRHDPQTTRTAEELAERLPRARHVIVDDASHDASNRNLATEIVRATDELAAEDPCGDGRAEAVAERPWWATALAAFCAGTVVFLVARDLFLPDVRDTEVWLGFEVHGLAALLTAPLHWLVFAIGAWGYWRLRPWIWPWAAVYAFHVAVGHLVWNLTSPSGGGWSAGLWQLGLFSIPGVLLLAARPPRQPVGRSEP